jgi:hypothetical protein
MERCQKWVVKQPRISSERVVAHNAGTKIRQVVQEAEEEVNAFDATEDIPLQQTPTKRLIVHDSNQSNVGKYCISSKDRLVSTIQYNNV